MPEIIEVGRPAEGEPILRVRGLTKKFPKILANDSIDLDIYQGEVHALLGENGAGKSTLVKCMYGFYQRDSGEITVNRSTSAPRMMHARTRLAWFSRT